MLKAMNEIRLKKAGIACFFKSLVVYRIYF